MSSNFYEGIGPGGANDCSREIYALTLAQTFPPFLASTGVSTTWPNAVVEIRGYS